MTATADLANVVVLTRGEQRDLLDTLRIARALLVRVDNTGEMPLHDLAIMVDRVDLAIAALERGDG